MIRKIKACCLALTAIAAMGIVVASVAQASQFHGTHNSNVSVFGEQLVGGQIVMTSDAGTLKCTQVRFEGTIPYVSGQQVTAEDLTLTPTFATCDAFGQAATFDLNGCKLTITGKDTAGVTYGNRTTVPDLTGCTTGKSVEVTTGICRLTLPAQPHLGHVIGENNATTEDVEINITLSGITYQSDGPLCPAMATGATKTNGTLTGKATFQTRVDTGSQLVTLNGHQYEKLSQTGEIKGFVAT